MDECLSDLDDIRKVVDDCLIYSSSKSDHEKCVRKFLERCQEKQISLNPDKMQICQEKVRFAGFDLTKDGYSMSEDITRSIKDFPKPDGRTTLRGYFGLVNQLGSSNKDVSGILEPLRSLLSEKNAFVWTPNHDLAFQKSKELLTKRTLLTFFDVKRETRLVTDASKTGIGFVIQQMHDNEWKKLI